MKDNDKHSEYLTLCELLRNIRVEKNVTQSYIADLLDKPQSYVSKYESGKRRLDFIEVRNICSVLDVSFAKFTQRFDSLVFTKKK